MQARVAPSVLRRIIGAPFDLWHWQQRRIDLMILWPIVRDKATSLDQARGAFALHASMDTAWTSLGEDEMLRRIGQLT